MCHPEHMQQPRCAGLGMLSLRPHVSSSVLIVSSEGLALLFFPIIWNITVDKRYTHREREKQLAQFRALPTLPTVQDRPVLSGFILLKPCPNRLCAPSSNQTTNVGRKASESTRYSENLKCWREVQPVGNMLVKGLSSPRTPHPWNPWDSLPAPFSTPHVGEKMAVIIMRKLNNNFIWVLALSATSPLQHWGPNSELRATKPSLSRRATAWISREHGGLSDVVQTEVEKHYPLQAYASTAMRRASVSGQKWGRSIWPQKFSNEFQRYFRRKTARQGRLEKQAVVLRHLRKVQEESEGPIAMNFKRLKRFASFVKDIGSEYQLNI